VKEIELTLRLRNNRLKERREALGMTQPELAAAAGVSPSAYQELEALRRSPRKREDGGWRDIATQLARFHCVEPEELFPPSVLAVETPVATRRINAGDILPLLSAHQQRLLEGPDAAHDRAELREQVQRALAGLRPREAEVLRLRFGLDGGDERTLEQAGVVLDVQKERVRQLEARALRRLRHPSRADGLRDFLPEAREEPTSPDRPSPAVGGQGVPRRTPLV
jgi:RNA polymerase sigma factor (sigma-70 family)